ncbi:MAG: hypothetical protein EBS90_10025 [Betaproteobacteria bacterium]|nr:hypothetical protein [Betaproteobacteria bacterium]
MLNTETAQIILGKLHRMHLDMDWPQAKLVQGQIDEIHDLIVANSDIDDLLADAAALGIDLTGVTKES